MDLTSLLFTIFSNAPINVRSWSKRTDPARCVEQCLRGDEACVSDPRWNVMDRDDPVEDHNDDKNKQSESKVIQEGIAHHLSQPIQNGNFASGPGTSIEIGQKDCESYVRYWGHSVKRDAPFTAERLSSRSNLRMPQNLLAVLAVAGLPRSSSEALQLSRRPPPQPRPKRPYRCPQCQPQSEDWRPCQLNLPLPHQ